MCEALEKIKEQTYAIEHNANCPSPYLVRLVGKEGRLDNKSAGNTADILGYGKTLEAAVTEALAAQVAGKLRERSPDSKPTFSPAAKRRAFALMTPP
jgi:hypothetical protein